ncbi:MAG: hypothetical protein ACI9NC_004877, partial [Verrucomicrobiales bacterium]
TVGLPRESRISRPIMSVMIEFDMYKRVLVFECGFWLGINIHGTGVMPVPWKN